MWGWLPATLLATSSALAADQASAGWSCPEIRLLPSTASDNDRRITCEIPGELRRQVAEAEREGLRVRAHDVAAWTATDALNAISALDNVPGTPLGWLTREVGSVIETSFFASVDGIPHAFAEARFELDHQKAAGARRLEQPRPADDRERRLLRARETALAAPRVQCSKTLNTVILEEPGFDDIRVYLFSAWEQPERMPMGGHSRFRISRDGERILDVLQQTQTCNVTLDATKARTEKAGFITDLVDESPTGMQVFLNIQYDVPVVVVTELNRRLWRLEAGRIRAVGEGEEVTRAVRAYFTSREAQDGGATEQADRAHSGK